MRRILTVAEPDVMVQLVRLIVLYEDLKLEVAGLQAPPDKEFDEVSKHYRSMYFIRRAFATLWEMDSAFHKLNMLKGFKKIKRSLDRKRLKKWVAAVASSRRPRSSSTASGMRTAAMSRTTSRASC